MGKVLVVDDSVTVRNEVGTFLKNNGIDTVLAGNGKEGLDKLRGDPSIKLIISDVNMPVMDGLTMAEKVRSELNNKAVNIIMLTTESDPRMKQRGKDAGVKGWIVKPFKGDAVIGAVKKMVG